MRHRKAFSMSIGGLAAVSIVCTALLISLAPRTQAAYWGGNTGDWTDDEWYETDDYNTKIDPSSDEGRVIVQDGGDVTFSSGTDSSGHLFIGKNVANTPTFTMTGGDYTPDRIFMGNVQGDENVHSYAEFNMTGGTVNASLLSTKSGDEVTNNLTFGSATESGAPTLNTGRYEISLGGVGENTYATSEWSGYGTIDSSGQLRIGGMYNSTGTELIEVEGGNLTLEFEGGEFGIHSSTGSDYTLRYKLGPDGASTLDMGSGDVAFGRSGETDPQSNQLDFELGSVLGGYTHDVGMEHTILTTTGDFTNFGEFANVSDGDIITTDGYEFEANYDTSGTNSTFSITAVPEPSSLMLLGLAGLLLMRRRRL